MNINTKAAKIALVRKGMTMAALAEKAGLTSRAVGTILKRGSCSIISVGKLANALDMDVEELMEVNDNG